METLAGAPSIDVSFVFPCLNEEQSIGACIQAVHRSFAGSQRPISYEIIVADNGSADRSAEVATAQGARVVAVSQRGYGAALRGGIAAAQGAYVIFADADETYLYEDTLPLYQAALDASADMAIASRMKGAIAQGAMPFLHRYLGTPVLTALINLLFGGGLSDCNSGFRCIRKAAYNQWGIRSNGMEFASELLIKALKNRAKTVEISSGLRPGRQGRVAHLRTWRDGMRHLLFILSERPRLFEEAGLTIVILSTLLQAAAFVLGPVNLAGFNVFDLHSKALLLMAALTGMQSYLFSCMLFLKGRESPSPLTAWLINIDEASLFFFLAGLLAMEALFVLAIVLNWVFNNFANLDLTQVLFPVIHLLTVPGMLLLGLLALHVLKKSD